MNRLDKKRQTQILSLLVEGSSIRATVRLTGTSKNTVTKLLRDLGEACYTYQDEHLRNLPCKRIQCDEIWSFCFKKEHRLAPEQLGKIGIGDLWTWTALCPDTKIVPCWLVGRRDLAHAYAFMKSLSLRLSNRVQLTTDGYQHYLEAIKKTFGTNIDYAMLCKEYEDGRLKQIERKGVIGFPELKYVSTSLCERLNLSMRTDIRRFTRRTNAYSKKAENHHYAVSMYFMYYNFVRIHQTLKTTPAKACGVTNRAWKAEEIVDLLYQQC